MEAFNLKGQVIKDDEVRSEWFEVPELGGFFMKIAYLSKVAIDRMTARHTRYVYSKAQKARVPKLNTDGLYREFASHIILDWKGLTAGMLKQVIVLKDAHKVPDDAPVPYNEDNVVILLENARAIDNWVVEIAADASPFNTATEEEEARNETETKN